MNEKMSEKTEKYEEEDLILPMIKFGHSAKITIKLSSNYVSLQIGPRDWQWSRVTGELLGCGTELGSCATEESSLAN